MVGVIPVNPGTHQRFPISFRQFMYFCVCEYENKITSQHCDEEQYTHLCYTM